MKYYIICYDQQGKKLGVMAYNHDILPYPATENECHDSKTYANRIISNDKESRRIKGLEKLRYEVHQF